MTGQVSPGEMGQCLPRTWWPLVLSHLHTAHTAPAQVGDRHQFHHLCWWHLAKRRRVTASAPWTLLAGGVGTTGLPTWPHRARTQGCWLCGSLRVHHGQWQPRMDPWLVGTTSWRYGFISAGEACACEGPPQGRKDRKHGHGQLTPWEGLSALMSQHHGATRGLMKTQVKTQMHTQGKKRQRHNTSAGQGP